MKAYELINAALNTLNYTRLDEAIKRSKLSELNAVLADDIKFIPRRVESSLTLEAKKSCYTFGVDIENEKPNFIERVMITDTIDSVPSIIPYDRYLQIPSKNATGTPHSISYEEDFGKLYFFPVPKHQMMAQMVLCYPYRFSSVEDIEIEDLPIEEKHRTLIVMRLALQLSGQLSVAFGDANVVLLRRAISQHISPKEVKFC